MTIYNYDINGWYLGSSTAVADPIENPDNLPSGKFLVPSRSTTIAPPTASVNQTSQFISGAWVLTNTPEYTAAQQALVGTKNAYGVSTFSLVNGVATPIDPALVAAQTQTAAMNLLRTKRNALLSATDFTQLADVPAAVKAKVSAYVAYRQALRDLPANTLDATAPVYPTLP